MSNQHTKTAMDKKLLLVMAICAMSLCTWKAQAASVLSSPIIKLEIADPPQGFEKIDLLGDLLYNVGPNAVVAGANDNAVYIHFNQSFGNVSISIYNGAGLVVYSTVVNTSVQQTYIIPIFSGTGGPYTIVLDSANGYAEGDFEHI